MFAKIIAFQIVVSLSAHRAQVFLGFQQDFEQKMDGQYSSLAFVRLAISIAPLFIITFATIEKVNKEKFVVSYIHHKTHNLYLEVLNKSSLANVVVSIDGRIQFYNQPFQTLVNQWLNVTSMPTSIYALTH